MKPEVTLEVIYPYPPDRVWRALTDRRVLAEWLLPNSFEPRVGHCFHFVRPGHAGAREVIECEVIDLQPPSRLVYTWRAPSDRAPSVVTWSLEPVPGGTRLRLTHTRADEATAVNEADAAAAARAWENRLADLHRRLRGNEPALWSAAAHFRFLAGRGKEQPLGGAPGQWGFTGEMAAWRSLTGAQRASGLRP